MDRDVGDQTHHRSDPVTSHHCLPDASDQSPLESSLGTEFTLDSKLTRIYKACGQPGDLSSLTELAASRGGLLTDDARRVAWKLLLGLHIKQGTLKQASEDWRFLPQHKDEGQVKLDVDRSFIYYPKNESFTQLDRRKEDLSDVIIQVLRRHPMLCYFQGFHDIVQVILLVAGKDDAPQLTAHLALLRIRDFMLPSLSPSLAHLRLLPAILQSVDPELRRHLAQIQPFFALASTLTLYAHEVQEYKDIARLFDFLISQEAVVSIYLFAVIVLSRRDELLEISSDDPDMLYHTLSKLPKALDLEDLIQRTMVTFHEHPPEHLPARAWSKISAFSVLKTTRRSTGSCSLEQAEELFTMQALQLKREEIRHRAWATIWKYRRPAGSIGLAILVGIASYALRKNGLDSVIIVGVRRAWDLLRSSTTTK